MTPTLQYPSLLDPGQIAVQRDVHHFRLIVPPLASIWLLPKSYLKVLALLLLLLAHHIYMTIAHPHQAIEDTLIPFGMDTLAFSGLFYMAYARTHCWTTFEITADRFRILSRVFWSNCVSAEVARCDSPEIRLKRYNGKLILRVARREMREFFISTNLQVTQNVVDKLREAMEITFEPIAPGAVVAALPCPPVATPAQQKRGMRWVTVLVLALIAAVLIWPSAGIIIFIVVAIAAVPLGIKFGTQEKDFYP